MELIVSCFCLWRALSCVLYCSVWVKFRSGGDWRLWDKQDIFPSLNVSVSSFLFPFISPCLYPSAWSSFLHLSLYFFLPSLLDHLCPYFQAFWYPVMAEFVQDLCNLLTIRWGTNPVLEKDTSKIIEKVNHRGFQRIFLIIPFCECCSAALCKVVSVGIRKDESLNIGLVSSGV